MRVASQMSFPPQLACTGKLVQGRFVARRR
jgi:hypothetical protein